MTDIVKAEKKETAVAISHKMAAGLDGAGNDFLMPRFKIFHPMSKASIEGAKLGLWYESNGSALIGETIRFCLLSQKNKSFTQDDGKIKNYKYLLVADEANLGFPSEVVLSASGIRAAKGLNTALLQKKLVDKADTAFQYLIEAKIEVQQNDNGKFGVPKFTIVGTVDAEAFDKVAGLHAQFASVYATEALPVDTATAYDEKELS